MTSPDRIDFTGIGAARSGTSWLGKCLQEHPQIGFSAEKTRKELNFFNSNEYDTFGRFEEPRYPKGVPWYFDQFPPYEEGKLRGEFSITYLWDPVAAERLYEHNPDVKLIATLRNPVEAYYSLYRLACYKVQMHPPATIEEAVRLGQHMERNLYHQHLTRFFEKFPAENLCVILYDDIRSDPNAVLRRLYEFLGVDPEFVPVRANRQLHRSARSRSVLLRRSVQGFVAGMRAVGLKAIADGLVHSPRVRRAYHGVNRTRSGIPPLPAAVSRDLQAYYAGDVEKLEGLIQRDLSAWKADVPKA